MWTDAIHPLTMSSRIFCFFDVKTTKINWEKTKEYMSFRPNILWKVLFFLFSRGFGCNAYPHPFRVAAVGSARYCIVPGERVYEFHTVERSRLQPTSRVQPSTAEYSRAQPSTAKHSRAQWSTALAYALDASRSTSFTRSVTCASCRPSTSYTWLYTLVLQRSHLSLRFNTLSFPWNQGNGRKSRNE